LGENGLDRNWLLADDVKATNGQFMGQDGLINRFEKPWAKSLVDVKSGIYNLAGDIIDGLVAHTDICRRV